MKCLKLIVIIAALISVSSCTQEQSDKIPKIVFVSKQYGHPEIFSMHLDGSNRIRQTSTAQKIDNLQPRVSPSGDKIAFISNRDGTDNIFVMDRNGKNARQITHLVSPHFAYSPVWSPDGARIAFIRDIPKKDSFGRPFTLEIFSVRVDGKDEQQITRDWELSLNRIDWHHKENKLIFVSGKWGNLNNGFILDLNSKKALTPPQSAVPITPTTPVGYFSFSPDSPNKVLAAGSPQGTSLDIYLIEKKEGEGVSFSRLTDTVPPANSRQPSWSPDGKKILFVSNRSGVDQIYEMENTGANQRLVSTKKVHEYDPAWF